MGPWSYASLLRELRTFPPCNCDDERGKVRPRVSQTYVRLLVAFLAWVAVAGAAHAADASEAWPELSFYKDLNSQTRLFLNAAYAEGKESDTRSLDLAAYFDVSLKPFRKKLQTEDWQGKRYFWMRIGYDRIFKATDEEAAEVSENRGIVSFHANAQLPAEIVLEARARADLRWIGDDYSTRYRFRLEVNRKFTVRDHAIVPYFNIEWFYDTRYDGWARTLYKLGPTITAGPHFRYEIYVAHQEDRLPSKSDLDALGLNLKWYY